MLMGCAGKNAQVTLQSNPPTSTAPVEAPWAKLWSAAFSDDFKGQSVQVTAQWLGVATGTMCVASSFAPWKDMVSVGLAPVGAEVTMGQAVDQQWCVFVPKSKSDSVFTIATGSRVRVVGRADVFAAGSVKMLVLVVDRIEVIP
jgi:hypothetical protein